MVAVKHFNTPADLCAAAAEAWVDVLGRTALERTYTVALSGGRVASEFYRSLCQAQRAKGVEFPRQVHFFWADERCVGPESPDSNYKLAWENLFDPLKIPKQNIHRIEGELTPDQAAQRAEIDLRQTTGCDPGSLPVLDMVFLGMGEDGHTASLFPQTSLGNEPQDSAQAYVPVTGPKPPPRRITLTYPVIIAAAEVWALVTGTAKTEPLARAVRGDVSLPFGRVVESRVHTIIWTDVNFC